MTRNLELSFGYSFIYWSRIVTAGDSIDPAINPSQFTDLPLIPRLDMSMTGNPCEFLNDVTASATVV